MEIALPDYAGVLLLISGPAGSGKTTLCQGMLDHFRAGHGGPFPFVLEKVVTATTRNPRKGEKDGRDYYFLDRPTFESRIREEAFLEYAEVYQNLYGTPKSEVLERLDDGNDLILSVDVQGAAAFRAAAGRDSRLASRFVSVFVMPPTLGELEQRLIRRGQNEAADLRRRLEIARLELQEAGRFHYCLRSSTRQADLLALQSIYLAEKLRVRAPGA